MLKVGAIWPRHLLPHGEDAGSSGRSIPTALDADALASACERPDAERHALAALLTPALVAVVGAGRESAGVGHEVLLTRSRTGSAAWSTRQPARRPAARQVFPDLASPAVLAIS